MKINLKIGGVGHRKSYTTKIFNVMTILHEASQGVSFSAYFLVQIFCILRHHPMNLGAVAAEK